MLDRVSVRLRKVKFRCDPGDQETIRWPLYRSLTAKADADWVRGLTAAQRFAIYQELFNVVQGASAGRRRRSD